MRTPSRRGANAIELALVMPVFLALVAGLMDYGWYFWREVILVNSLREAVRSGGFQLQSEDESGATCATCVSVAQTAIDKALKDQGYSGVTLTPKLERYPATGAPCVYEMVLTGTVTHQRMFPLIPGPSQFSIRLVSVAQNLTCT